MEIIHGITSENGLSCPRFGLEHLLKIWIANSRAPKFDFVLLLDDSIFKESHEAKLFEYECLRHDKQVIYTGTFSDEELAPSVFCANMETVVKEKNRALRSEQIRDGLRRKKEDDALHEKQFKTKFVLQIEKVTKRFTERCDNGLSYQEVVSLGSLRDSLVAKLPTS